MTKLNIEIQLALSSSEKQQVCCSTSCAATASILGVQVGQVVPASAILADKHELETLQTAVDHLMKYNCGDDKDASASSSSFDTLNLVFKSPSTQTCPGQDRSPIDSVFANPMRSIHAAGEEHLACFAHLELFASKSMNVEDNSGGNKEKGYTIHLTALEYSRSHRAKYLRQEFGSWLLEDHIEKAVIATTLQGKVCFWNRFAGELYQYTREEAMGESILELTPSDMTQEQGMEIMAKLMNGEHWTGMFQVHRKDKSNFMAHVTDTPIRDDQGNVRFIVGVSDDYSQLHDTMARLEHLNSHLEQEVQSRTEALLERESALRRVGAAVQESDTAVFITSEKGVVVWANSAVSKMLRAKSDEDVLGRMAWDVPLVLEASSGDGDREFATIKEFFRNIMTPMGPNSKPPETHCVATLTPSSHHESKKEEIVVAIYVQKLLASPGTMHGRQGEEYMVSLRNITADRRAEEAQLLAEKASASSKAKTEMMRMLSHELRTPLQGIMGMASTILSDMPPESDVALLDGVSVILASSRLLLTLINNTLDAGRIDADMLKDLELNPVPVRPLLSDAVAFCRPFAALNDVQLDLEDQDSSQHGLLTPEHIHRDYIVGNRLRVEQVLINLISNAVKYTYAGTSVEVFYREMSAVATYGEIVAAPCSDFKLDGESTEYIEYPSNNFIIISVRDHGPGIPPQEYSKVFGVYSQLQTANEKDLAYSGGGAQSSGSGLGLHLCKSFVNMMNGHIWFNESPGGGSTFSFCIPSTKEPTEFESLDDEDLQDNIEVDPSTAANFRVMIADDSIINLKVLARMLGKIGVHCVQTAANGQIALEYLVSTQDPLPNILLIDLQMPVMDGFELISHLREANLHADPVLVACSADWSVENEERINDWGFEHFLRKPVTYSDLSAFLGRLYRDEPGRFV